MTPISNETLSVALIGCGAIGSNIVRLLSQATGDDSRVSVVGVLKRSQEAVAVPSVSLVEAIEQLVERRPALIVECAGQTAVRTFGPAVLKSGIDFMVVSAGALADATLFDDLMRQAKGNGARLLVPAGAVAGLDGLSALRLGGLNSVRYTATKHPRAWKGTPAEKSTVLDTVTKRTIVFEGSAREAALAFPQNANIAATVGLAGVGLDKTIVRLVADPGVTRNSAMVEAEGSLGTLTCKLESQPSSNPKTSATVAYSVVNAILRRSAALCIQ